MRFYQIPTLLILASFLFCAPIAAQVPNEQPQRVSVCQLSHFGSKNDGKLYETFAIYSTTYRHGAYLMAPNGGHCGIQLGMRQGDVDGSVARFDKALFRTKTKHGLAAARSVTVVLIYHWVKDHSGHKLDAFGRPWGARGVVELRKVVSSAYYKPHPNHSLKQTPGKPGTV